jgi:hypothetical protein
MDDTDKVEIVQRLIGQSRSCIGAGVSSLIAAGPHLSCVNKDVRARISEAMEAADHALALLNALEQDQSRWGNYQSHASGDNN